MQMIHKTCDYCLMNNRRVASAVYLDAMVEACIRYKEAGEVEVRKEQCRAFVDIAGSRRVSITQWSVWLSFIKLHFNWSGPRFETENAGSSLSFVSEPSI